MNDLSPYEGCFSCVLCVRLILVMCSSVSSEPRVYAFDDSLVSSASRFRLSFCYFAKLSICLSSLFHCLVSPLLLGPTLHLTASYDSNMDPAEIDQIRNISHQGVLLGQQQEQLS